MLIDLKVSDKRVLVIGGGQVGERKVQALLHEGAEVTVASKKFTQQLKNLGNNQKVHLKKLGIKPSNQFRRLIASSDLVIAATDDEEMNHKLSDQAKIAKIPICVVDNPEICDFYFPATTDFGSIRLAVSTGGKSPAMASALRKRLEKSITTKDVLQVELQNYARTRLKIAGIQSSIRKKILYEIMKNRRVSLLLEKGRLKEAKRIAKEIVETA